MPKPSWEDLDVFFDHFAIEAQVEPRNGDPFVVSAIFDERYYSAEMGTFIHDVHHPRLTVKSADVDDIEPGDGVTVDGTDYEVVSHPERDGTGTAILTLSRLD